MPTRPACRGSICPRAESTPSSAPACTTTTTSPRWSASFGQWRARLSRYDPEVDVATTVETGSGSREPRPDRRRALLVAALGLLQLAPNAENTAARAREQGADVRERRLALLRSALSGRRTGGVRGQSSGRVLQPRALLPGRSVLCAALAPEAPERASVRGAYQPRAAA